jgi:hypothetical protein
MRPAAWLPVLATGHNNANGGNMPGFRALRMWLLVQSV